MLPLVYLLDRMSYYYHNLRNIEAYDCRQESILYYCFLLLVLNPLPQIYIFLNLANTTPSLTLQQNGYYYNRKNSTVSLSQNDPYTVSRV